jgi:hypothetical protein
MWILHEGLGQWDGTIINAQNPQRRDTQNMAPWGHIVIQYNIDNPGIWPFHCHIAWHLSTVCDFKLLKLPIKIKTGRANVMLGNVREFYGAARRG